MVEMGNLRPWHSKFWRICSQGLSLVLCTGSRNGVAKNAQQRISTIATNAVLATLRDRARRHRSPPHRFRLHKGRSTRVGGRSSPAKQAMYSRSGQGCKQMSSGARPQRPGRQAHRQRHCSRWWRKRRRQDSGNKRPKSTRESTRPGRRQPKP